MFVDMMNLMWQVTWQMTWHKPHDKNNYHNEFVPIGPYTMGYFMDTIY
jgi:hypothetical protein